MIFAGLQSAFRSFTSNPRQPEAIKDEKLCNALLFTGGILIPLASIAATIINRS
jgi:hypothetical protein